MYRIKIYQTKIALKSLVQIEIVICNILNEFELFVGFKIKKYVIIRFINNVLLN